MSLVDDAYDILTANKNTGSIILSWSYKDDGEGVVVMGRKNPLSINSDGDIYMEILNAWNNEEGLDKLKQLGIVLKGIVLK